MSKVGLIALVIFAMSFCLADSCWLVCRVICIETKTHIICGRRCGLLGCRRRREIPQNATMQNKPFPEKFENYDRDNNGEISLKELALATSAEQHANGTERAFHLADKDEDGKIVCSEFKNAPFLFDHQPSCQESP